MTNFEHTLWRKIERFQLDKPEIEFNFSTRLARENGWTQHFSNRVIEEYKKFLFLCSTSTTGITPSDAVDQAWHLHLTYTKSYWIDLCKDTLKKEIHHNPTKGGQSESEKFDGFYTQTLTLYKNKFGQEPPQDIWPKNEVRFSDIDFQRVNIRTHWVLKKPLISKALIIPLSLIIICLSFIQAYDPNTVSSIAIATIAVLIVAAIVKAIKGRGPGNDNDSTGCTMTSCSSDSSHSHSHSGCNSGCSGCSASGCSGCSGGSGD